MKRLGLGLLTAGMVAFAAPAHAVLYDIHLNWANLASIDGVAVGAPPASNVQSSALGSMGFHIADTGLILTIEAIGYSNQAQLNLTANGLGIFDPGTVGPSDQIDNWCTGFLNICSGRPEAVKVTIQDAPFSEFVLVEAEFGLVQNDDEFCWSVNTGASGCPLDIPGGNVYAFLDNDGNVAFDGNYTVGEMTGSEFIFGTPGCSNVLVTGCKADYSLKRLVWEVELLQTDVPEPTTLSLFGLGLLGLGYAVRRRRPA